MQLYSPGDDGDHSFGLTATNNATFTPIQEALKLWANARCLSLSKDSLQSITGPAFLITPSLDVAPLNDSNAIPGVSSNGTSAMEPRQCPPPPPGRFFGHNLTLFTPLIAPNCRPLRPCRSQKHPSGCRLWLCVARRTMRDRGRRH